MLTIPFPFLITDTITMVCYFVIWTEITTHRVHFAWLAALSGMEHWGVPVFNVIGYRAHWNATATFTHAIDRYTATI